MSKNILCAVDLAHLDIRKKILSEGLKLVDADAVINVVTVVPDYGMNIVGSYFEEGMMDKAIDSSNKTLHQFISENLPSDTKVRHVVACGSI